MVFRPVRGEDVDARADLYSLGVIAYRALTGRPAFVGKDFARMLRAEPAPPHLQRLAVDPRSLLPEPIPTSPPEHQGQVAGRHPPVLRPWPLL